LYRLLLRGLLVLLRCRAAALRLLLLARDAAGVVGASERDGVPGQRGV
jgi:hypothetical protein